MNPNTPRGRTLITGGAGFIGSALAWALNELGYEDIIIADHLGTDEKWRNLVALRYIDYIDADTLIDRLEEKPDYLGDVGLVLHLGACSATTEADTGYLMDNNFEYTKRLAHWALANKARFVYASSAATYGDGAQGMDDSLEDISILRPLNMYGYSKHLFDTYAKRTGMLNHIVGLKYFNVFGPNEAHKGDMRSVVHKAFGQIRDTGKVELFKSYKEGIGHGEQQRDFLYVKDAVAMTLHLASRPLASGLYNLGSGSANSWLDLTDAIFASLGIPPNVEFIEMPEVLREKYQYFTQANVSRLIESGYTQQPLELAAAVNDYVTHYLTPDHRLGHIPSPRPAATSAAAQIPAVAKTPAATEEATSPAENIVVDENGVKKVRRRKRRTSQD